MKEVSRRKECLMTMTLLESFLKTEGLTYERQGDALLLEVQEGVPLSVIFQQEQHGYLDAKVWVPRRPGKGVFISEAFRQALERGFSRDDFRVQVNFYHRERTFCLRTLVDPYTLERDVEAFLEASDTFLVLYVNLIDQGCCLDSRLLWLAFWSKGDEYVRPQ